MFIGRSGNAPFAQSPCALHTWLSGASPPGPFFKTCDSKPLLKLNFVSEVRKALTAWGLPAGDYTGHSFRISAATAAIFVLWMSMIHGGREGLSVLVYHLTSPPHVHTSHHHLMYTPHITTSCTHLTSPPHVHTSHQHLMYTPHITTSCTHLTSPPHVHTSHHHLMYTPHITTSCTHLTSPPHVFWTFMGML